MHSYHESLALINNLELIQSQEIVDLSSSLHRTLAEDLNAPFPSPSFTNSQMDGFAFCFQNVDPHKPLRVIDEIFAGHSQESLSPLREPQECVRIMTGAPLPPGADTVIPVEQVLEKTPGIIELQQSIEKGSFVRHQGEDLQAGEILFRSGTRVSAEKLSILANFGINQISVRMKPLVILLTTGDELLRPGELRVEGKIFDSNGPFLSAAFKDVGLNVHTHIHMRDDLQANIKTVRTLLLDLPPRHPILIISSGAVSAGEKDFIPALTKELNFSTIIHKVAVRPGKPVFLAQREDMLWFGIPGNPISTMATWYYFIRPLLTRWAGIPALMPIKVRLTRKVKKPKDLRCFYRASIEDNLAFVFEQQGSSHFKASIMANGWVELPEGTDTLPEGSQVEALITQ